MLLRKISLHVKQQDWLAVFLDFLIVVVGIFVGLQVTSWHENRAKAELSKVMTERLKAELREEAWTHQYLVEYYDDVRSNITRTLNVLEGEAGPNISDEQFVIAAYRGTQMNMDYRVRATFDELTANGNLDLISDKSLLKTAIHVYNFGLYQTIRENGLQSQYRERFRMIVPIAIQQQLRDKCGGRLVEALNYDSIVDSLDYPCHLSLPQAQLERTADTLKSDQPLLGFLRLRFSQVDGNLSSLTQFYPEVNEGLKALQQ